MQRDHNGRPILEVDITLPLRVWMDDVAYHWESQWKGTDHRYGQSFAAFVGERFLTDFGMRDIEQRVRR